MASFLRVKTLLLLTTLLPTTLAIAQPNVLPQKPLLPAVHWDHEKADLQHLVPVNNHDLYFTTGGIADPTLEHTFAKLSTTLESPAVILDHSDFVESVECQSPNLQIAFKDDKAHAFALKAWANEHHFILATYTTGCRTSAEQRTFWLVDYFVSGPCNRCITAVVEKELATQDAIRGVDMTWGTHRPLDNQTLPSTSGKGSSAGTIVSSNVPPSGGSLSSRRMRSMKRQASDNATAGDCGPPPSTLIDGFPAATCNSTTFDQDLDDAIGYYLFDEDNYSESLQGFAPGLSDLNPESNEGFAPLGSPLRRRRVRIQRRTWFSDSITELLAATLAKASAALQGFAEIVTEAILNGVKSVGQQVLDAISKTPDVSLDIPIRIASSDLGPSPWGEALQIFQQSGDESSEIITGSLAVYCVQCGADGQVHLSGQARFSIADGLESASVLMSGNIAAGLSLGIDANAQIHQTLDFSIAQIPIKGFSVKNIVTVGPAIGLGAEAELDITLAGQILAGVNMSISNFAASLDFVNGSNSNSSGFTPEFTRIFNATSQVSATAAFGLPLTLGVGLEIPPIDFQKTASISDKPSLEAKLKYTGSTSCQDLASSAACLNGIDVDLNFVNSVYANIFGLEKYDLSRYSAQISRGCTWIGPQLDCRSGGSRRRSLVADVDRKTTQQLRKRQGVDGPGPFDYVTSPEANTTANDYEFRAINETVFDSLDTTSMTVNGSQVANAPDTIFVTIADVAGNNELLADPDNGNLYYASPGNGSLFAVVSNFVEGDGSGRFFHYYPDIMATYNVSRLRLSDERHIPVTSDFVGLAPVDYDDDGRTVDVYIAVDTIGGVFFAITCDIQNQPSKVFLVRNINQGIQKLQDPGLRYTVTGGIVENCYFLPWATPSGSINSTTPTPSSTAAIASLPASSTRATTSSQSA